MGSSRHNITMPDKVWNQIPGKKSTYITEAVKLYTQNTHSNTHNNTHSVHTKTISVLEKRIEDITQERDRYRNKAEIQDIALMSFFPRIKYKKLLKDQQLLMAPQQE